MCFGLYARKDEAIVKKLGHFLTSQPNIPQRPGLNTFPNFITLEDHKRLTRLVILSELFLHLQARRDLLRECSLHPRFRVSPGAPHQAPVCPDQRQQRLLRAQELQGPGHAGQHQEPDQVVRQEPHGHPPQDRGHPGGADRQEGHLHAPEVVRQPAEVSTCPTEHFVILDYQIVSQSDQP